MSNNQYTDGQLLRAILESAVDGIITIDSNGMIKSANKSAVRLFGYDISEMLGMNVSSLMPEPHRTNHHKYVSKYIETGNAKIIGIGREVLGLRKDGQQFPFWLSVGEVKLKDERIFTGIIHDVSELKDTQSRLLELNQKLEKKVEERTNKIAEIVNKLLETNKNLESEIVERKKAEASLQESQEELQSLLKKEKELGNLKSRFVTLASHEFRTPLSNILSSVSLIARYDSDDLLEKRQRHIDKIKDSVRNLNNILNDFLSLSKIEEGRILLQPHEFDFVEKCREEIDYISDSLKPGQTIELKFDKEIINIYSDLTLIKNILINLLSNASKYSAHGKQILVHIKDDRLNFNIKISDQGIGIPEGDHKYMFDRFFRASNAINIQGTGLGLNIVKSYVDLLGGEISFVSNVDNGSTFEIKLPKKYIDQHE
ncbi:MAG: PAS domain S-box protein [Chitinophagales bacterium]|nr:PAS domain S-box protein [Chitinophagales bacterium]